MAVDFKAFSAKVDKAELQNQLDHAADNTYEDVPDGEYIVQIDKMEIKPTKKGDKLMFSVQCSIQEGEYKKRKIFFNRTVTGNKQTERWSDGAAIAGVCTWVNHLVDPEDEPVKVNLKRSDYLGDLADQILDVFQSIQGAVELSVSYAKDDFNPIVINEVFDIAAI